MLESSGIGRQPRNDIAAARSALVARLIRAGACPAYPRKPRSIRRQVFANAAVGPFATSAKPATESALWGNPDYTDPDEGQSNRPSSMMVLRRPGSVPNSFT